MSNVYFAAREVNLRASVRDNTMSNGPFLGIGWTSSDPHYATNLKLLLRRKKPPRLLLFHVALLLTENNSLYISILSIYQKNRTDA